MLSPKLTQKDKYVSLDEEGSVADASEPEDEPFLSIADSHFRAS